MLSRPKLRLLAVPALVIFSVACGPRSRPQTGKSVAGPEETRTFSAVLFPYIPDAAHDDFAGLVQTLTEMFEAQNPDIDLQLTMNPDMNLYDAGELATLLGSGVGSYDMVELDTILLGDLVAGGLVQALPFSVNDWGLLNTAVSSAQVASTLYGVPTYLCGNYVYSWDPKLAAVDTGQELIDLLSSEPDPADTPLVGDFAGSWTLPALYVDSWADTHDNVPIDVSSAYALPLDPSTMGIFPAEVGLCGPNGGPCLDGTYKDNTLAETVFGQRKANGFVGYSERLFFILEAAGGDVTLPHVISAPIGTGSNPVMFVDALVLNRACTGQCATDAETFARFMSSLEVRNLIAFSQDVGPDAFPRYLLQALQGFYTSSPGSDNVIYQQLYPFVQLAEPFPNTGFPEARQQLNPALEAALTGSVPETHR